MRFHALFANFHARSRVQAKEAAELPDAHGDTPLHAACSAGASECARLLIASATRAIAAGFT